METLAAEGTPFAAFCALRVLTATNHRHAFVRHFTTLKRDLRGSRITGSNDQDAPVEITPSVGSIDSKIVKAVLDQEAKLALVKRCTELSVALARNLATPDTVKTEKQEFESKKCAAVLQ